MNHALNPRAGSWAVPWWIATAPDPAGSGREASTVLLTLATVWLVWSSNGPAQARDRGEGLGTARVVRSCGQSESVSREALGRTAAARRHSPRHRPESCRVADGRANIRARSLKLQPPFYPCFVRCVTSLASPSCWSLMRLVLYVLSAIACPFSKADESSKKAPSRPYLTIREAPLPEGC